MSELQDINVQIWEEITRHKVGMLKKVKIVRLKPRITFLFIYYVAEEKKQLLDVKSSLHFCEGNTDKIK